MEPKEKSRGLAPVQACYDYDALMYSNQILQGIFVLTYLYLLTYYNREISWPYDSQRTLIVDVMLISSFLNSLEFGTFSRRLDTID